MSKAAIAIIAIVAVLVILGLAIMSVPPDALPVTQVSKYDGLSEDQVTRVKILHERCEASAYLNGAGSDTAIQENLKRCADVEAKQIEKYRSENSG